MADGEVRRGVPEAYADAREARRELGNYFRFYNDLRPHQALGEQRQLFWPLLPHQKMLPSFSRLLIDAHRSDVNRSLLI